MSNPEHNRRNYFVDWCPYCGDTTVLGRHQDDCPWHPKNVGRVNDNVKVGKITFTPNNTGWICPKIRHPALQIHPGCKKPPPGTFSLCPGNSACGTAGGPGARTKVWKPGRHAEHHSRGVGKNPRDRAGDRPKRDPVF